MTRVINLREIEPTVHLNPSGLWVKGRVLPAGNPYRIGKPLNLVLNGSDVIYTEAATRDDVLRAYRWWAEWRAKSIEGWLEPLRGKRLACWCVPEPCHAQILAEMIP